MRLIFLRPTSLVATNSYPVRHMIVDRLRRLVKLQVPSLSFISALCWNLARTLMSWPRVYVAFWLDFSGDGILTFSKNITPGAHSMLDLTWKWSEQTVHAVHHMACICYLVYVLYCHWDSVLFRTAWFLTSAKVWAPTNVSCRGPTHMDVEKNMWSKCVSLSKK